MTRRKPFVAVALALLLPFASPAATPLAPAAPLNQSGEATQPDLAASDAGFIASWTRGGGDWVLRRFNASGAPLGAEIPIALTPAGGSAVRIASAANGDYVVVRTYVDGVAGNASQIVDARKFAADHTPLTSTFEIARLRARPTPPVSVAMNAVGEFIVAWSDPAVVQLGDPLVMPVTLRLYTNVVRARRYDVNAQPMGEAVRLSTEFVDSYLSLGLIGGPPPPAVSMDTDVDLDDGGRAVVVWKNTGMTRGSGPVFMRRVGADGQPAGSKQRVSPYLPGALTPRVAIDGAGNATIAWTEDGALHVRRYAADGAALGDALQVEAGPLAAEPPDVAAHPDGRVTLVWRQAQTVRARQLAADGSPLGTAFDVGVAGITEQLREPRIAYGPGGRFMVAWQRISGVILLDRDVFGRVYQP